MTKNSVFTTVTFDAKEEKASDNLFVHKNGLFEVDLLSVFGYPSKDGRSSFIVLDFLIKGTDEVLSIKELYTYTDKKSGEVRESKAAAIVRAMVGFVGAKAKVTARWSAVTKDMFGKSVDGHELKQVQGKSFWITNQVERKLYTNNNNETKAQENNTIRRVFSGQGLSLAEFKDAIDTQVPVVDYVGTALDKAKAKEEKKATTYKYRDTTYEEWTEVKEEGTGSTGTQSNTSAGALPSAGTLPSAATASLPSIDPAALQTPTPATPEPTQVANGTSVTQQVSVPAELPSASLPQQQETLPTLDNAGITQGGSLPQLHLN